MKSSWRACAELVESSKFKVLVIHLSFTFTIISLFNLFLVSVKTGMAVTERNVELILISMGFRPLG